jgi:hypothetical protein
VLRAGNAAYRRRADAQEAAPPQRQIQLHAVASGSDYALRRRKACQGNHGVEDVP